MSRPILIALIAALHAGCSQIPAKAIEGSYSGIVEIVPELGSDASTERREGTATVTMNDDDHVQLQLPELDIDQELELTWIAARTGLGQDPVFRATETDGWNQEAELFDDDACKNLAWRRTRGEDGDNQYYFNGSLTKNGVPCAEEN